MEKHTVISCVCRFCSVSSVAQSCLTLCNPKDCSTPGLPVHHQLPKPTQTHVHQVGDAIQPFCWFPFIVLMFHFWSYALRCKMLMTFMFSWWLFSLVTLLILEFIHLNTFLSVLLLLLPLSFDNFLASIFRFTYF